jgi:hypothetical protein
MFLPVLFLHKNAGITNMEVVMRKYTKAGCEGIRRRE